MELHELKLRETLNLAEVGKNKEITEKENLTRKLLKRKDDIKLLKVQKAQMQAYFLQLEAKVGEREKEIHLYKQLDFYQRDSHPST